MIKKFHCTAAPLLMALSTGSRATPRVLSGSLSRRLNVETVVRSGLPRGDTAITFVAAATRSRLQMLPGLCSSWGSVLSLAVYASVVAGSSGAAMTIANVTASVQAEFER